MRERSKILLFLIDGLKDRLREGVSLFPLPALISVVLCLLLMGQLILGLNQRLGNPSDLIELPADPEDEGALWFSLSLKDSDVIVTTATREIFTWKEDTSQVNEISPFLEYLKQSTEQIILSASLAKKIRRTQTTAVLAVDQRIKFKHMKLILSALAVAGISDYAFEVRSPMITADVKSMRSSSRARSRDFPRGALGHTRGGGG